METEIHFEEQHEECPICMETFELDIINKVLTECGHALCNRCFIILNFKSDKCPICRQKMNNSCHNPPEETPSIIHFPNYPRNQTHNHIIPILFQRIFNCLNYRIRVYPE
jgi:RNA polymerase subunit RPABC4/transcription elongation factor Spt4